MVLIKINVGGGMDIYRAKRLPTCCMDVLRVPSYAV